MPSATNKGYDYLLIVLDELANGVSKHTQNVKITASIYQDELRIIKKELEALRENYIQKEKEARVAYSQFEAKFKIGKNLASNNIRIIKGAFGPKSPELLDFGIMPEKSRSSKSKKAVLMKSLMKEREISTFSEK